MAGHRAEARVDGTRLAAADLVDRRLHVVVDAALGNAAEDGERVVVRVEQHLVRLLRIRAQQERSAVAKLELRYVSPVLAPVELKRLARGEDQRPNAPRLVRVCASRCRSHVRAKAATRS